MSKLSYTMRLAVATAFIAGLALPHTAAAQGKGKEKGKSEAKGRKDDKRDEKGRIVQTDNGTIVVTPLVVTQQQKRIPPGQAKKHVTILQGTTVTREVLLANGYQIVRVAPSGASRIIYYRRGNNGNGRGLGPVQQIIVVPAGDVVRFQSVPQSLLQTILSRLGM
jgi:hypothetical protein